MDVDRRPRPAPPTSAAPQGGGAGGPRSEEGMVSGPHTLPGRAGGQGTPPLPSSPQGCMRALCPLWGPGHVASGSFARETWVPQLCEDTPRPAQDGHRARSTCRLMVWGDGQGEAHSRRDCRAGTGQLAGGWQGRLTGRLQAARGRGRGWAGGQRSAGQWPEGSWPSTPILGGGGPCLWNRGVAQSD